MEHCSFDHFLLFNDENEIKNKTGSSWFGMIFVPYFRYQKTKTKRWFFRYTYIDRWLRWSKGHAFLVARSFPKEKTKAKEHNGSLPFAFCFFFELMTKKVNNDRQLLIFSKDNRRPNGIHGRVAVCIKKGRK